MHVRQQLSSSVNFLTYTSPNKCYENSCTYYTNIVLNNKQPYCASFNGPLNKNCVELEISSCNAVHAIY